MEINLVSVGLWIVLAFFVGVATASWFFGRKFNVLHNQYIQLRAEIRGKGWSRDT